MCCRGPGRQQACPGIRVRYEDIVERLMELRKEAWDR